MFFSSALGAVFGTSPVLFCKHRRNQGAAYYVISDTRHVFHPPATTRTTDVPAVVSNTVIKEIPRFPLISLTLLLYAEAELVILGSENTWCIRLFFEAYFRAGQLISCHLVLCPFEKLADSWHVFKNTSSGKKS